ncbi:bifunctional phosphopantothenoylcysteine decarboxylase/phosphopantothenate--cysteine ligase CoaBC [cyanobiont of Ornithocercus magnificus]|nr:bifunctional phosphopantothenoylcysteine decarboxylase/phosphopantothenate--cysteine ligase CoaBC [cyanobiont of Ornithocercus magnificus]
MRTETIPTLSRRRILVGICGSIAAVKAPLLVSDLVQAGAEVRCLVTHSAARLVSPLALASLSRHRCYQDDDQWLPSEPRPLHIALSEWAELVLVAPLSASSLARWCHGLADGLLASTLLACDRPIVAAPAMNTSMWENLTVRSNWSTLLKEPHVLGIPPGLGLLACDRIGDGRMVHPELLLLAVASALHQWNGKDSLKKDWSGHHLLVTAGPTSESLDPVRVIRNRSSGRMGVLLAQVARFRGASVDLIHGPLRVPAAWLEGLTLHAVETAVAMGVALQTLQPAANALALAAAVADLRPASGPTNSKLSKQKLLERMRIGGDVFWEPVPDLLAAVMARRCNGQVVLGFAALTGSDTEMIEQGVEKRVEKGCDLLMVNPVDRPGQGLEEDSNGGWLLGPSGQIETIPVVDKLVLAHQLLDRLFALQTVVSARSYPAN